jgi:hypothetical protein
MNLVNLWELSGKLQIEIFLTSRINSSGNRKDAVLDKYKNNLQQLKSNSRLNSLFIASILVFPAIIAITSVQQSLKMIASDNVNKIFFLNSVSIGTYYIFNLVFMLLFGLLSISNLLRGAVFKFLHTLPFSKGEIQILGVMTFIRLLFFQLGVMLVVFPFGMLYATRSVVVFLVSFAINLVNLVIISYLLIIVVDKLSTYLMTQENGFGIKSLIRYLFMVVYILSAFSIYYFVGALSDFLLRLYDLNQFSESSLIIVNNILSIVAFPFSTGYLLSIISLRRIPSTTMVITMVVGLIILGLVTWRLIKLGNKILLNIAFKDSFRKENEKTGEFEVEISTTRPLFAYIKMNILTVIREMPSLISVTMAVLFPLLPLIQNTGQDIFVSFLFYSGFIIIFSSNGLSTSDGSLGGLMSSLPFGNLQMLRGKHLLLSLIYFISFGLMNLVTAGRYLTVDGLVLVVVLAVVLPNLFLILKSYFFGKINNQYTLYDIEDDSSFFRNLILIVPVLMAVGIEFVLFNYSYVWFASIPFWLIPVGFNFVFIMILEIINRNMFVQ